MLVFYSLYAGYVKNLSFQHKLKEIRITSWGWAGPSSVQNWLSMQANVICFLQGFHWGQLPLCFYSTDVLFPWGCVPLGLSSIEVILHWGPLPLTSSSIEVVLHWGCLPLRSSCIDFIFHWGHLPLRSSSIEVIFHWGYLPLMLFGLVWFLAAFFQVSVLSRDWVGGWVGRWTQKYS